MTTQKPTTKPRVKKQKPLKECEAEKLYNTVMEHVTTMLDNLHQNMSDNNETTQTLANFIDIDLFYFSHGFTVGQRSFIKLALAKPLNVTKIC